MTRYDFASRFVVAAAPARVFAAVLEPESWLVRLGHVRTLERLHDGSDDGVGRTYATEVGAVPYRLRWTMEATRVVPHVSLAWQARGDLSGHGSWELSAVTPGTLVVSRWAVRTTPVWMNLAAPVARPVFVHNHDRVMRAGAELLAEHLGVELASFSSHDTAREGADTRGQGDLAG